MRFWTIQSREVMDKLLEDGVYYPDIDKSQNNLPMKASYRELLANYNVLNKEDNKGLIFGFYSIDGDGEIEDIEEIYEYLNLRPELKSLFENLNRGNYCILELEIEGEKNTLPIDFNDYIKLTLWANYQRNYNEELLRVFENEYEARKEILKIKKYLPDGREKSEPGSFIQNHYSHLDKKDLVRLHTMIDPETGNSLGEFPAFKKFMEEKE